MTIVRTPSSADLYDREHGYALVAMLAVMSLLALLALAVAPSIQQQTQREREKEAVFRGEQVADAIRSYYQFRGQYGGAQGVSALPTSIDQLVEGIQIPGRTKKLQILRLSASRDPLSEDGEWRLISPTSEDFARYVRDLTVYSGGTPPTARIQALAGLVPRAVSILNTGTDESAPGGENTSPDASGPFIGVASRSQRDSVITYFGIERHDHWVFTPLFR